jgi:hypothetical protein
MEVATLWPMSRKVLNHGAPNPIVARLSLQILEILKQCNASNDIQDAVGNFYVNSLLPRLIRCWEIEERFKRQFVAAVDSYKPPASANAGVEVRPSSGDTRLGRARGRA